MASAYPSLPHFWATELCFEALCLSLLAETVAMYVAGEGDKKQTSRPFLLYFGVERLERPKTRAAEHANWKVGRSTTSRDLRLFACVPSVLSNTPTILYQ